MRTYNLNWPLVCVAFVALFFGYSHGEEAKSAQNSKATLATGEVVATGGGWKHPQYPTSIFYSGGDALCEYQWMPMDSEATITTAFDILKRHYNCNRMIWRDGATEWQGRFDTTRKDSCNGVLLDECLRVASKTCDISAKAAKAKGMEFWVFQDLNNYGGKADTEAGVGRGSWMMYDKWIQAHPEYRCYDRARITYVTGVTEFGYPEVRKQYVGRFEEMFKTLWKKYDGMLIYSYEEHMAAHYTDEFIYSDVACSDYKKKYGVDPRTQPFDLDKFYEIKGEYLTQYLRELRPIFKKYGKKISFTLNPENLEWPVRWLSGRSDILTQGRIKTDWRTWVKEGLVDELLIWGGPNYEQKYSRIPELLAITKGTGVKVTILSNDELLDPYQYAYADGVRRVITIATGSEDGYPGKRPASDINSPDYEAILCVLRQVRDKELDVPAEKIIPLLSHPNPMVRRQAAKTLGERKMTVAVAALDKAAATEKEPSVFALINYGLGKINGPNSVAAMRKGFGHLNIWPARMSLRDAITVMGPERYPEIVKAYDTNDAYFREVLMEGISRRVYAPELFGVIKCAMQDKSDWVRWWAVKALENYPAQDASLLLYSALDDKSDFVQNRAATSFIGITPRLPEEQKQRVFDKLMAKYKEFGIGCKRTDHDWGWRPIGEAMMDGFGQKGKQSLVDIVNGDNIPLAQLTWQVLFLPENGWHPIAREEMEKRYKYYPDIAGRQACPSAVELLQMSMQSSVK